jgi:hypothetical protein
MASFTVLNGHTVMLKIPNGEVKSAKLEAGGCVVANHLQVARLSVSQHSNTGEVRQLLCGPVDWKNVRQAVRDPRQALA